MSEIKNEREIFVTKWVKQLSEKLKKSEEDLLVEGLRVEDFGGKNIYLEYEDHSYSFYKYAFYVENEEEYAIFTEHCGYQEHKKDWINDIQETEAVYVDKVADIKWLGEGKTSLEINNEKLYLNKLELKSLHQQLSWFIHYYGEDFSPKQLHLLQNLTGTKNTHNIEDWDEVEDDNQDE